MQSIKIQYIGKSDSVLTEYDGIKYVFSKSRPVQIIPLKVFSFLQDRLNPFKDDIIPFQDAEPEKQEIERKTQTEEMADMEKDLEEIKEEPKKQKGKYKKARADK